MKWINLFLLWAILIVTLNVNNAYAENPEISKNRIEYFSLENLTFDFKKQSSQLLDLEGKYPGKNVYLIEWENPSYLMGLEHNMKEDKLSLQMKTRSGELIEQEVYLGKSMSRLEDVANSKMEFYDYPEDEFIRKGNTSYLIHPSYKK